MTEEEYKKLFTTIQTTINMTDVSRETKREAIQEVKKVLIKKIERKNK